MYEPAPHDEITGLVSYLEVQLSAIRAAPLGLTEEQATATRAGALCRSAASSSTRRTVCAARPPPSPTGAGPEIDAEAFAAHAASFTVGAVGDDARRC